MNIMNFRTTPSNSNFMAYRLPYGRFLHEDKDAVRIMKDAGVNLISISPMNTISGLGDPYSGYPNIWKWLEQYDFDILDQQFNDVLKINSNARFLLAVDLNTPTWLARHLNMDSFYSMSNCSLSPKWKDLTTKYLKAFLEHCETHFSECIEGYIPSCGRTMEWIELNNCEAGRLKSAFYPQWCASNGLSQLPIPSENEIRHAQHEIVRDPQTEAHVIQWLRYVNNLTADLAIYFIQEIRATVGRKIKIGMFFGHVCHARTDGHLECERVFDTAPPDFVIGAGCNSKATLGETSGYIGTYHMLKRRGIGYLHECERFTSTSNLQMNDYVSLAGSVWFSWQNISEDRAGLKREFSMSLINGFSIWWFNIWGGLFKGKETLMEELRMLWDRYAPLSTGSHAEFLVVYDTESDYYINSRYDTDVKEKIFQDAISHELRDKLSASGVVHETASWRDLSHMDLTRYKLVLFQNAAIMNNERMRLLEEKIFSKGRTVAWIYSAGCILNNEYVPENVKRLTGTEFMTPGLSVTGMKGWRSAYFGHPADVTGDNLRGLAIAAGVHDYCSPKCAVWASREFLMVHSKDGGGINIKLQHPATRVKELFSGRIIAVDNGSFTDSFEIPDTKLYHLTYDENHETVTI